MKIVHLFIIFIVKRCRIMFYLKEEQEKNLEMRKKCCWVASEKLFCDKRTWSECLAFVSHHEVFCVSTRSCKIWMFIVCGHEFSQDKFSFWINFHFPWKRKINEQFIKSYRFFRFSSNADEIINSNHYSLLSGNYNTNIFVISALKISHCLGFHKFPVAFRPNRFEMLMIVFLCPACSLMIKIIIIKHRLINARYTRIPSNNNKYHP